MPDWLDFTGKVALVTGSSRGIGAGMIQAFDRLGARCAMNYVTDPQGRNRADAEQVAAKLKDPLLVECDVGDLASVTAMMEQVRQKFGGLDILINNAGIIRDRTIKKMTESDWDAVIRVNLTGTYHCTQQAIPLLRNGGRIVNLSSVTGQIGLFGQANYASSKAGIMALTRVTARELARQQITVNAIAPGFIDTDMSRTMPEDVAKKLLEQVPIGRMGRIEDVVDAALFLCSDHAQYITGQILHVNGGFYM
ncbi:MAG TPA: 3-oxoacyl-ACP reductase FabG [Humisphaera sp.]|jgi:3-oxoacyl-[acyl-carrier protein] reductase|nr:3-oxoacyl-ACP reductase FabG [Humisphaera sp.]